MSVLYIVLFKNSLVTIFVSISSSIPGMNPTVRHVTRPRKIFRKNRSYSSTICLDHEVPSLLADAPIPKLVPRKRYISTFSGPSLVPKPIKEPKENLKKQGYEISRLKQGWMVRVWIKGFVRHQRKKYITKICKEKRFLVKT